MRLPIRRFSMGLVPLAAALAIAALPVSAASGKGKVATYKLGKYSGKTSQGYPFSFKVFKFNHASGGGYGVGDVSETTITGPCKVGIPLKDTILAQLAPVHHGVARPPANSSSDTTQVVYIKLTHHGTASGYIREFAGSASAPDCDSGKVTFTASHH